MTAVGWDETWSNRMAARVHGTTGRRSWRHIVLNDYLCFKGAPRLTIKVKVQVPLSPMAFFMVPVIL